MSMKKTSNVKAKAVTPPARNAARLRVKRCCVNEKNVEGEALAVIFATAKTIRNETLVPSFRLRYLASKGNNLHSGALGQAWRKMRIGAAKPILASVRITGHWTLGQGRRMANSIEMSPAKSGAQARNSR